MTKQQFLYTPKTMIPADGRFVVVYRTDGKLTTDEIVAYAFCDQIIISEHGPEVSECQLILPLVCGDTEIVPANEFTNYVGIIPRDKNPDEYFA